MAALPSLRQLSYLVTLSETLHFTEAARRSFVTQSTLSGGIMELERLLGGVLVERDRQNVRLTPLGEQVVARARVLLADAQDLMRLSREMSEPLTGDLHLGVIPTIAPFLLSQLLDEVHKQLPKIQLHLHEAQSEKIVEKYGINHISTGDVLRAEMKNGTELGKTAKGYIDQGQLIPDELMIDILASVFDSFKDSKGVIFDGFPRTIAQAEALKKMLAERGQEVSVMLDLDVPEEELMKRLIKRGQESGRADDNEETIKKRLVVYHSQTAPLIDWYKQDGKYQHIQGFGVLEEIFADVCKAIDAVK